MSLRSLNLPVIDFVGKRKFALIFSAFLLIVSIASLGLQGLKFGIDFTGGTLIELGYEKTADLESIRTKLAAAEYEGVNVQYFDLILKYLFSLSLKQLQVQS